MSKMAYCTAMTTNSSTFAAAVAGELRAERARQDITWDALVEATGISKSSVLRYLKGTRDIPLPEYVALCGALGLSPTEVFERAEESGQQH